MVTYGFFNSVNGDRRYDADQISNYYDGLITSGVYRDVGGGLEVSADSGMDIEVASGRAMIDCKWLNSDAPLTLTVNPSHAVLNRYTAVVVRLDIVNRLMEITTKDGEPASEPTKPAMQNDASAVEKCLAYIYIPAGATSIASNNIEDMRASGLCGWVTGLVNQNTILSRWKKRIVFGSGASGVIPLDMQNYTHEIHDVIHVYINGLFGYEGVDFTLDTTPQTPTITVEATNEGTEVIIDIIR